MTDEEVFDVENEEEEIEEEVNAPMDGEYPGQPDATPYTEEELEEFYIDGFVWGQEDMGVRKEISVMPIENDGGTIVLEVTIDGKPFSPKETAAHLLEASVLFGSYVLAVDEYKEGSKKMWAISQCLYFQGKDLSRTIAEVRISAARQIYGYLKNIGAGDRFMLLNTAKTAPEKKALEKPIFFNHNYGYQQG